MFSENSLNKGVRETVSAESYLSGKDCMERSIRHQKDVINVISN